MGCDQSREVPEKPMAIETVEDLEEDDGVLKNYIQSQIESGRAAEAKTSSDSDEDTDDRDRFRDEPEEEKQKTRVPDKLEVPAWALGTHKAAIKRKSALRKQTKGVHKRKSTGLMRFIKPNLGRASSASRIEGAAGQKSHSGRKADASAEVKLDITSEEYEQAEVRDAEIRAFELSQSAQFQKAQKEEMAKRKEYEKLEDMDVEVKLAPEKKNKGAMKAIKGMTKWPKRHLILRRINDRLGVLFAASSKEAALAAASFAQIPSNAVVEHIQHIEKVESDAKALKMSITTREGVVYKLKFYKFSKDAKEVGWDRVWKWEANLKRYKAFYEKRGEF